MSAAKAIAQRCPVTGELDICACPIEGCQGDYMPAQQLAQRFTALCPYCNHMAEVQWEHAEGSPSGRYVWAMHPADPRQTLCVATLTTWRGQEGGGK